MREEFGFVGGYVDADGAIAFAAFAGQAEVEGFFYCFAAPAVANDCVFSGWRVSRDSLRHFPEQVGAAAGRVFFFAGDAVAGAHYSAFFAAAFADAYAAQGCGGEAAVVVGKLKIYWRFPEGVVGA